MLINIFSVLVVKRRLRAYQVSKGTGIAESTLSSFVNIVDNEKDIKLSTLIKLCNYLNCTLSELIEYIPEPNSK
ncbi:MAG: helix-turn-helix transcriptional regulator [Lactococcus lactis]|jgi:putative transcriptional regulator|nr:helix-turn-helix transcriptional regulator [Lactococcus lactis]